MQNNKNDGNVMFHIALDDNGALQPIINARIPFGNVQLLQVLLHTTRPGASFKEKEDGSGYLFVYDNNLKKPYPSVMIWKYITVNNQRVICDMEREDLSIVSFAVENYLR